MEYSLAQLEAFVVTVEQGSFKGAATRLGKSSQVVARLISMMEDSCNVQLFERQVRRLVITDEAQKLYRHAKRIMLEADKLNVQLASFERKLPHSFTLAIDNTLSCPEVTECYLAVQEEYPTLDLKVLSGGTVQVLDWIKSGEAEVALAFSPLEPVEGIQDLTAFNYNTAEVASPALVKRGEVLSQDRQIEMTQIVPQFIYDYGHEQRYVQSDKTIICNGFDEMLTMLCAGAGWARVPGFKVRHLLESGVLHDFVTEGSIPVSWHANLYYPNEENLSLAGDGFIERVLRLNKLIR